MSKHYDVIIIGAGLAGIFAGYELIKHRPELKVAILEQGADIAHRSCPIIAKKTDSCINCRSCAIMRGFGGAGAFSDGKFNFTTQFGGWLNDYISDEAVMDLIEYVDKVNQEFGATDQFYSTFTPAADVIRRRAIGHDLHLMDARCKHLGTERNREILASQAAYLSDHLDLLCGVQVLNINPVSNDGYVVETKKGEYDCDYLIVAPAVRVPSGFPSSATGLTCS